MKRHRIPFSDRHIAGKILMTLAHHHYDQFCLCWVYDYDHEFLTKLAAAIPLPKSFPSEPYLNRLRKICRKLEAYGILSGTVMSCQREYIGEPKTLKRYQFGSGDYETRLAPDKYPHYKPMGKVETELDFLLERAYPKPLV